MSWFDEQPVFLAELVASMGRAGVDHVVAVDGAFAMYPQARGSSDTEQAHIVTATAVGAGMGVTLHVPRQPWAGNEVEKRSFLFSAGHLVADPGRDWFWVCDADELITAATGLRGALEATDMDVAEVLLEEHATEGADEWYRTPARRLFRAQCAGITVDGYHGRYLTGAGEVLWDAVQPPSNHVDVESLWDVRMRHRPVARADYRNAKRRVYCDRRSSLGFEVAA